MSPTFPESATIPGREPGYERMIDPGLGGRVALVTGANQGIGAAAALRSQLRVSPYS